jgi:hypothetical protein
VVLDGCGDAWHGRAPVSVAHASRDSPHKKSGTLGHATFVRLGHNFLNRAHHAEGFVVNQCQYAASTRFAGDLRQCPQGASRKRTGDKSSTGKFHDAPLLSCE